MGAWSDEKFGGFGREVVEGDRRGDDVTDPDGPKWTAWSVSRCRDRGLGETGGWVAIQGGREGEEGTGIGTPDGPKWTAQSVG